MTGYTCFHSHLVPGVDDGARDEAYSAGALAAFRREGVGQVITTPHFDGSLTHNVERLAMRLAELDAGWDKLRVVVDADTQQFGTPMRVERGVEVMLDVPDPVLADARLRLAGTRFVLVEYPMLNLPPVNAAVALGYIRRAGWIPVVAHPERYRNLESLDPLREFLAAGAYLQVNAGSLFGDYGSTAQARAQEVLGHGLASYVCSDYHARGEPGIARFARALAESGFGEQVQLLIGENPGRLLRDEAPLGVSPMATVRRTAGPWWRRLFGAVGRGSPGAPGRRA